MDYLALILTDQLLAERRAEARRHRLAKQAARPRARRTLRPGQGRALGLTTVRANAEGAP